MVKNWNELKSTGNPAVDAVMTTIYVNRRRMLPLRSLSLSFRTYGLFEEFLKQNMGATFDYKNKYQFDGVDIECNPAQARDIVEDYWPMKLVAEA